VVRADIAPPNLDPILDLASGAGTFEDRSHAEITSAEFPYTTGFATCVNHPMIASSPASRPASISALATTG